jgi:hypothetical protein
MRNATPEKAKLWDTTRNECGKRFNFECVLCRVFCKNGHCHHWQETRAQNPGRVFDKENLVWLCSRCHEHNGADKKFYALKKRIESALTYQHYKKGE